MDSSAKERNNVLLKQSQQRHVVKNVVELAADVQIRADTRNDAKWSKPHPPPSPSAPVQSSTSSSSKQSHGDMDAHAPRHQQYPQRQSVGNAVSNNRNQKTFNFDDEKDLFGGRENKARLISSSLMRHDVKEDEPANRSDQRTRHNDNATTRTNGTKRPSTATPQVAQVEDKKRPTAPLKTEDDTVPPPAPPTRPPSSPTTRKPNNRITSSNKLPSSTASWRKAPLHEASAMNEGSNEHGNQVSKPQGFAKKEVTSDDDAMKGRYDDASERENGQFDDASEAIIALNERQCNQFDDASETVASEAVTSDRPSGQFDDASEATTSANSSGVGNSITRGVKSILSGARIGRKSPTPSASISASASAVSAADSFSRSQRKKQVGLANTTNAVKDALARSRSKNDNNKKRNNDDKSRDASSSIASIGSFSPFRKRAPKTSLVETPHSAGTVGRTSKNSDISVKRSERSVSSIQCVVSEDTEKTKNLSSHHKINKSKRNPKGMSIRRHVGKQPTDEDPRHTSSVKTMPTNQDSLPASSSEEEREKTEQSLITRMSRQIQMERRESDVTGFSSMASSAFSPISVLSRKSNRIRLHVYDLVSRDTHLDLWGCHFPLGHCFNVVNSSLHSIGTGAYHCGVEVNGVEYAYGANSTKGLTGVFTCMPKHSPGYQYRTTIDFGERCHAPKSSSTDVVKNEFPRHCDGREVVRAMASQYMGTDYDLLRKNCCTFAHDACIRLGVEEDEIPSWFHNLAATGAMTQDVANSTFAPLTNVFSSCELDKFAEYISETAFEDGFEVIEGSPEKGRGEQIIDITH